MQNLACNYSERNDSNKSIMESINPAYSKMRKISLVFLFTLFSAISAVLDGSMPHVSQPSFLKISSIVRVEAPMSKRIELAHLGEQIGGMVQNRAVLTAQVNETTLAALLTTWDNVRDLIKAKSIAGGHYHCPDANPIKVGNYYVVFITIEEIMGLV